MSWMKGYFLQFFNWEIYNPLHAYCLSIESIRKLNHPLHQIEIDFVTSDAYHYQYRTSGILYYSNHIIWIKPCLCPNSTVTTKHHELIIARQTRSVEHKSQNSPQSQ